MNILIFLPEYFPPKKINANHSRVLHIAEIMQENHNVLIICPNNKYLYDTQLYKNIRIYRFPYLKNNFLAKIFTIIMSQKYIEKILKRENITLDMLWYNSDLAFYLSSKFQCLKIYDVMGILTNELAKEKNLYNLLKSIFYKFAEKEIYKKSSVIITINKQHQKLLRKKFQKNIYILRDAMEHKIHINKILYEKIRKENNKCFTLFFVGSFNRKRFDKNIEGIFSLSRKVPNIKFIIAGEGNYKEYYIKKFTELGIKKSVEFIGHTVGKDLRSYIKASDICFSDVYLDGFPFKVFEYLALGKVTLVENSEGVKELLKDQQNSLLYKNSKDFEKKVMLIIKNKRLMKKIENNAFKLSKQHTWDVRSKEFNKILKEIIKNESTKNK